MDFEQTEDRRMLAETLGRYLTEQYPVEHRNAVAYEMPFHDPDKWGELAELGVLGALVPEEAGGFGGAGFDFAVVFEEVGRALCPEPLLAAVMASRLLSAVGRDQEDLISGQRRYGVAVAEVDAPYDVAGMQSRANSKGDGHVLSGRKCAVYGGQVADELLVAAMLDGVPALFSVQAKDAEVVSYGMIDGGGAAEVLLDDTPGILLAASAEAAIASASRAGIVALCAEAVGAMEVVYETTLEYLRTRKQFGAPIGSFQVLQHRSVDMLTEIEMARSITISAAARLDDDDGARIVSMAKTFIGKAARLVAEEAIQMHGGIAMTWEYPVSHYAKRLVMIDHQLGDTDHHMAQVMKGLAA